MSILFMLIFLMTPMMAVTNTNSIITTDEINTSRLDFGVQLHKDQIERDEQDDKSIFPEVISLSGDPVEAMPDFVYLEDELIPEDNSLTGFTLATVDPSKPNITAVYYQNVTAEDGSWVTWMQPGGDVQIWFEVKGPISISGTVIRVRITNIVSESSAYGSFFYEANLNPALPYDLDMNDTIWFYWEIPLPDEATLTYGWGTGKSNAFALSLFQPALAIPPQLFEVFYEGLYDRSSYLHMFGEVGVKRLSWYNYTYDNPSPIMVPCPIAERNWAVFPEFEYYVMNAPIWDIQLRADMRRDIVWWPDETILPYDATAFSKLYPGSYIYRPELTGSWYGWLLEEPWEYGSLIGQTRGLYMKFHLSSSGFWSELYSSNDEGELLLLVDNILAQPPQIEILSPMDAEVVCSTNVNLQVLVSDPNYNYQITDIQLYVDGISSSITHLYDPVTGLIETTVSLPESSGTVNITLIASDSDGLMGNDTVIITTENPLNYFPRSYSSAFQHVDKVLASQVFEWSFPLTYSPSIDLNITLTPRVEIGFSTSVGFDIYYSRPSEIFAGNNFSTYVSVSDPSIICSLWTTFDVGYDISLLSFRTSGSMTLYDELWMASRTIPLGIEILDLRYDLPGISEFVQSFTHYQIGFLDMIPVLGDFASLDLIIDIVPLLKVYNVIKADVAGTECTPDRNDITFVSDKMFAITSTVDTDASGGVAEVLLNNVNLESTIGLDLAVNLTLTGEVLSFTLANVDMNQWLYDNLGIRVPTLSLWNSKTTLPLVSQIILDASVANQQLEIGMTGISADEDFIDVELLLEDELGNGIESGSVTAAVDAVSCTVIENNNGEYVVQVPYRNTAFTLSVIFSKSGYIGGTDTFDIYIDPLIVDSTPPSIGSMSLSSETPDSTEMVSVTASLVDTLTGIANPTLHYSIDHGASWSAVSMVLVSGATFTGTIPAQAAGTDVLYYIQVYDGAGNEVSSAQQSYTVSDSGTTTTTTTSTTTTTTTGTETSTTSTTSETTTSTGTPSDLDDTIQLLLFIPLGAVGVVLVVMFIMKKK
ncbi:MAG: hypothetical protein EAX95_16425 [Candidatus Thorarchaeota archaeon]|nr:hypothetical protein [Candidatus Thorarchaeota archaeon]